jgi:hypothetical protein
MKTGGNATQIAVTAAAWGAFLLVAVWGIVPLAGGRTLYEILAQMGGLSLTGAAAVISCVVAVLGALSLAFSAQPNVSGMQREEADRKGVGP